MDGNYDQWAWRDSAFRKKLSNIRSVGSNPMVPPATTQSISSEHYLKNLTSKVLEPLEIPPTFNSVTLEEKDHQALLDAGTGLYSWSFFQRWLGYEMKRGERYRRPLGILFIAVDGLPGTLMEKELTDCLLSGIMSCLNTVIRDADIVSRHPDFSLAIILPETNQSGLTTAGERIRQQVRSQPVAHAMQNYNLTVSIGGAAFPFHAKTPDELIARATQSLQSARERGGDRVCIQ